MNIGCDDCNDDGRTSPGSAIAMERGEASTVRMHALSNILARPCVGVLCFVCKAKLLLDDMCVCVLQKACAG